MKLFDIHANYEYLFIQKCIMNRYSFRGQMFGIQIVISGFSSIYRLIFCVMQIRSTLPFDIFILFFIHIKNQR